jgi:uncharacterized membrane protein
MPEIGVLHPQVVHFVIALGLVGVLLRVLSLVLRGSWLNSAAAVLIILAAVASVVAAKSGTDAHEAAERIPGAREAVTKHETWGERTRNILLGVAGLEILGLIFARQRSAWALRFAAAGGGLIAAYAIFTVADLGGDIVYQHAGGVGTRSGDPADIDHLLVAGLFYAARAARDSGRAEDAARLTDELSRRMPNDTTVKFLVIDSRLKDRHDPAGALVELARLQVPPGNPRLAIRHGLLTAEALSAAGMKDSARGVLTALAQRYPESRSLKDALDHIH